MRKKIFGFAVLFICLSLNVFAQTNNSKAYEKHSSNINIGYGIGNIWKHFLDKVIHIDDYHVHSTGPLALVYDYGISKRFSAGLTGSYYLLKGKYEKPGFSFTDKLTILTLLARVNYHFWTTDKFDPYIGGGLGINNSKYRNSESFDANSSEPSTFDYSAQAGIKYFPTKHFGLYLEAGYVAGSFVIVGIAGKF